MGIMQVLKLNSNIVILCVSFQLLLSCSSCIKDNSDNSYPDKINGKKMKKLYDNALDVLCQKNYTNYSQENRPSHEEIRKVPPYKEWKYDFLNITESESEISINFSITYKDELLNSPTWYPIYFGVVFSNKEDSIIAFSTGKGVLYYD